MIDKVRSCFEDFTHDLYLVRLTDSNCKVHDGAYIKDMFAGAGLGIIVSIDIPASCEHIILGQCLYLFSVRTIT